MGNTGVAIEYFFGRLGILTLARFKREYVGDQNSILPSPVNNHIKEMGILDSPAMICFPFKIALGYIMQSLEEFEQVRSRLDVNVYPLIMTHQSSGFCRERCYSNLEELILRDSPRNPYKDFDFYSINESLSGIWDTVVLLSELSEQHPLVIVNALNATIERLEMVENFEDRIRYAQSLGGNYYDDNRILTQAKHRAATVDLDNLQLQKEFDEYLKQVYSVKRERQEPEGILGLTGEIYLCEEFMNNSSHYLGEELLRRGFYFRREVGLHHYLPRFRLTLDRLARWLWRQIDPFKRNITREEAAAGGLRHDAGGHSVDFVALEQRQSETREYDGIVGIGPFGCAPNIEALSVVHKITGTPRLYIQIDEQWGDAGYVTKIEGFTESIIRKKR